MKLTKIVVGVWNNPSDQYTNLKRYYTDPYMEHSVVMYLTATVSTHLYKDNIHEVYKPGIHHLTRPL